MKKSLIALAVMAAAGAASAQSSVTLFGIVDAALRTATVSGGARVTDLANSGYNSSRLGFRGTEDLGGGLSAQFWLEGGFANDDGRAGTATVAGNQGVTQAGNLGFNFSRRSTVALAGRWGELRLGRDYVPQFWNTAVFDAMGTNGVGTTLTLLGVGVLAPGATTAGVVVRASNSIGYFLPPNLGGVYGQVGYWLGENAQTGAATEDDGTGYGLRVGYGSGPFNVAVGWGRTEFARGAATGDLRMANIGGQWDFGMARVMAQYSADKRSSTVALDGRGWQVGALVPVGAGEVRVAYSEYRYDFNTAGTPDPRARKLALGYVHNLSKRTAVYATVARVRNSGGFAGAPQFALGGAAVPAGIINTRATGFETGVRHSF